MAITASKEGLSPLSSRQSGEAQSWTDAYNRQLKFESDFDKQIKKFLDGSGPRARKA